MVILLGNHGETIGEIQKKAETLSLTISPDSNPDGKTRNIYVVGSEEAFKKVKLLIDEIIEKHTDTMQVFEGKHLNQEEVLRIQMSIPVASLSIVVGKNGENLR